MEPISVVIADDEHLAREGLATRLDQLDNVSVRARCPDGHTTLKAIQQLEPEVVFLDVEMPGLNGIEIVEHLTSLGGQQPIVVFITAYAEFAVQAFEFKAVDYLLKPYSDDRLLQCLERVQEALEARQAKRKEQHLHSLLSSKTGKSLEGVISSLEVAPNTNLEQLQGTISVKTGNEWVRIKLQETTWIEAAGDYMCVHTEGDTHIIRKTLKQFSNELDNQRFVMANRSAIVNLNRIERISPNSNGEYMLTLDNGKQLKVSRRYKLNFDELKH